MKRIWTKILIVGEIVEKKLHCSILQQIEKLIIYLDLCEDLSFDKDPLSLSLHSRWLFGENPFSLSFRSKLYAEPLDFWL